MIRIGRHSVVGGDVDTHRKPIDPEEFDKSAGDQACIDVSQYKTNDGRRNDRPRNHRLKHHPVQAEDSSDE